MLSDSNYINFEWDENKAYTNEQKHKVSFESATEVFSAPHARVVADLKHSGNKELEDMPEVDFSKSISNPYVGRTRKRVTINIDTGTVEYFKNEANETGLPYQTLINMYLGQCVREGKHLTFV